MLIYFHIPIVTLFLISLCLRAQSTTIQQKKQKKSTRS